MNFIGSRTTLIANVCALAVASIASVDGVYIVHECLGYYRPQDFWGFFTPVVVMFIIRNWKVSCGFLAVYVGLAGQMLYQARSIHLAPYACGGRFDDPLQLMAQFFFLSLICLAIYAVVTLVHFATSRLRA